MPATIGVTTTTTFRPGTGTLTGRRSLNTFPISISTARSSWKLADREIGRRSSTERAEAATTFGNYPIAFGCPVNPRHARWLFFRGRGPGSTSRQSRISSACSNGTKWLCLWYESPQGLAGIVWAASLRGCLARMTAGRDGDAPRRAQDWKTSPAALEIRLICSSASCNSNSSSSRQTIRSSTSLQSGESRR